MHQRAAELVKELGLLPHPEGGLFREVHKSRLLVEPADRRGPRAALTAIYFLLPARSVSRWHRVQSDEVWHFYEGAHLTLWISSPGGDRVEQHWLGPLSEGRLPVIVVPAGCWQAARSAGDYTLAGCTVGPGFEFGDFSLASETPSVASALQSRDPALAELL